MKWALGLKVKIGLGFFAVGSAFLALIIFGNIIAVQNIPPTNIPHLSASLQQVAEPTRYFNNIESEADSALTTGNLTQELASQLSKKLVEINPTGPTAGPSGQSLVAPSLTELIDTGAAEAFQQFDRDYFLPAINAESLKIISNSQEAIDYYAVILPTILKHRAADLNFSLEDGDWEERLPRAVAVFDEIINKLYQLPAPEKSAESHRRVIGLVVGKKRVLETLLNQKEDPIRAILAVQLLAIIDGEFEKLKSQ